MMDTSSTRSQATDVPGRRGGPKGRLTRRQQHIMDQLAHLIGAEGFRHLRVADIAERLGCSLTLLYGLAPNREELILSGIRWLFAQYEARMSALDGEAHCLDLLATSVRDLAHVMVPPSHQYYLDVDATPAAKQLRDSFEQRNLRRAEKIINRGISRGEIAPVDSLLAASIFSTVMIHATSGELQSHAELSRAALVERAAQLVLSMLQPLTPRRGGKGARRARTDGGLRRS